MDEYILDTDASDISIGAELIQVQNGEEKVIAYGSFALTKEQRKYCPTRKELLAVVRFTRQYRYYLLGRPFTVRTDHSSLTWLLNFKEPQGQLARWMEELSQYNVVLRHRVGLKHGNADALSRRPVETTRCNAYTAGVHPTDLPCGGCKYCIRADNQWGTFIREVDDAVPLTSLGLQSETGNEMVNVHGDSAENRGESTRSRCRVRWSWGTGDPIEGYRFSITRGSGGMARFLSNRWKEGLSRRTKNSGCGCSLL